jgi:hypothetical protein
LKFCFKRCTIAIMNETLMCADNHRMLEIISRVEIKRFTASVSVST